MKALHRLFISLLPFLVSSLEHESLKISLNKKGIDYLLTSGINKAVQNVLSQEIENQTVTKDKFAIDAKNIKVLHIDPPKAEYWLDKENTNFNLHGGYTSFVADIDARLKIWRFSTNFHWKLKGYVSFGKTNIAWHLVNPTLNDTDENEFFFRELSCTPEVDSVIISFSGGISGAILNTVEPLFRPLLRKLVNKQISRFSKSVLLPVINDLVQHHVNYQLTGKLDKIRVEQQRTSLLLLADFCPTNTFTPVWSDPLKSTMITIWLSEDYVTCFMNEKMKDYEKKFDRLMKDFAEKMAKKFCDSDSICPEPMLKKLKRRKPLKFRVQQQPARVEIASFNTKIVYPLNISVEVHDAHTMSLPINFIIDGAFKIERNVVSFTQIELKIQSTFPKESIQPIEEEGEELKREIEKFKISLNDIKDETFGLTLTESTTLSSEDRHLRLEADFV